ncbi:hypothetical protein [Microbulbifer rhizosphaerae]|uniref:SH3 domain-containing protein n=1 Tax=Microbulbifer rhizosphaerae TaxID=1562603 RepID=A0A7W4WCJ9_9GAMM|nr:hypothetical protein [Microbulbifer rhizosphaerae]MBB3061758.1 hypothetical protein [Microbulbifer rhizosphaerae]
MDRMITSINRVAALLFCLLGLYCPFSLAAPADTPDYYLCNNRVGGEWNFGRVPAACDVDPWGDPAYVIDQFVPVIFDDNVTRSTERQRYMLEVHAMLRDSVEYYLLARKPSASGAEVAAWQRANFAKAHQETFWTHYREATDDNIKMVRGDSGHGHGMVQIDDRWHFPKLEEGKGWHIFENIIYGMELFYDAWQDAANASCVSSPSNWRNRARSAYSVYNGGASKICRWTNPNDPWARNDIGYADKYDSRTWLNYISNRDHETTLDIPCFMEGNADCAAVEPVDADDPANWPGRQINLASGEACRFENNAFECVAEAVDMLCLNIQYGASTGGSLSPSASVTDAYGKTVHEKHACFAGAVTGLSMVGQSITSEVEINVRATPGGSALGFTSQPGKVYQVLDYVVDDIDAQHRYYLISENGKLGYIYAGEAGDHTSWTTRASHSGLGEVFIPLAGDQIQVVPSSGINLRDVPAGNLIGLVPTDEILSVISVVIQGTDNDVYYEVSYGGKTGYIYGGKVLNGMTLQDWIVPYDEVESNPYTPEEACGSGYSVINSHALTGGRIYLLYKSSTGYNCVVTMKASNVGTPSAVSASLQVEGGTKATDSGNFSYFAGPVKKRAPGSCVKWGGSIGSRSWVSSYQHCD